MPDIDLAAIFNELNTVASLAGADAGGQLTSHANAIPRGTTSSDLTWPGSSRSFDMGPWRWTSIASEHFGAMPTVVRLHCTFDFGGTYHGGGLYLANVAIAFVVDSIGLGMKFDVSGSFDDPTPIGDPPNASLKAHITIKQYQYLMLDTTIQTDWEFRGSGYYRAAQA
jgi:hypothetical protein